MCCAPRKCIKGGLPKDLGLRLVGCKSAQAVADLLEGLPKDQVKVYARKLLLYVYGELPST